MEITPEQVRAARALLGLDQAELAERAHISAVTIGRLERANMGDCATYALAHSRKLPLLFKGRDFSQTDIVPAWRADT